MTDTIEFTVKGDTHYIPNSWEKIDTPLFMALVHDFDRMAKGEIPPIQVKVNFVCNFFGWQLPKVKDEASYQNLVLLAEQVTFPFVIVYPEDDAALADLDPETRRLCKRIPPERLTGVSIARYLSKLDYKFAIDSCFCKQLGPVVEVNDENHRGYTIATSFNMLTCSLTALQYIEACRLIGRPDQLPLLAAILYYPNGYSSEGAHSLAQEFSKLSMEELQAIAFNFQAFNNYLFTKTDFALLTAGKSDKASAISTGALESLYNLSNDGLGDINTVERMNLIKYLTILRKKLIEVVQSLHSAKIEISDIAKQTGLPIHIINQII